MNAVLEEREESRADPLLRFRSAAAGDLRLLALLQDRELDRDLVLNLWKDCYEDFLGLRLVSEQGRDAMNQFRLGLTDLPTELNRESLDILAVEYADIFLNNSYGASPCESVWIDEDGLIMQEPMFQVRAWYARFGLQVEDWRKRSDDHLVNQLQFLAYLLDPEAGNCDLSEVARFMDEHLLRWVPGFAERVSNRCRTRLYEGLVRLNAAYLSEVRDLLAEATGEPIPSTEEIDERMRPKVSVAVDVPGPYVPGAAPSW
jgi:TorA maturation chaperone TorD